MLISSQLAKAFNEQIGHEFGASLQYLAIAAHFYQRSLTLLAKLFEEQAEEEKQHAMKSSRRAVHQRGVHIPAITAPKANFGDSEDAVQAALNWEKETSSSHALMTIANKENDYSRRASAVVHRRNSSRKSSRLEPCWASSSIREEKPAQVEAYLIHIDKAH